MPRLNASGGNYSGLIFVQPEIQLLHFWSQGMALPGLSMQEHVRVRFWLEVPGRSGCGYGLKWHCHIVVSMQRFRIGILSR